MKRWAILTILLYVLAMAALTLPLLLLGFATWGGGAQALSLAQALPVYSEAGYWVWLALMAAGQAVLLLVPISIAERRPTTRRRLIVPIVVCGLFLACLIVAGVTSLLSLFLRDRGFDLYAVLGEEIVGATAISDYIVGMVTVVLIFWVIWATLFYFFARHDSAEQFVKRAIRWLLRGSILELLVAVPSHIVVRQRGDCCAPLGTFWGITTGVSVMLLCFGPGMFFLFVERIQRLQPKPPIDGGEPGR